MTAISTGAIAYNDGKISFSVDFGRPVSQQAGNAANDLAGAGVTDGAIDFSGTTHDPIGFILGVQEFMYDTYGVRITRALASRKFLNSLWKSDKFRPITGFTDASADPRYLVPGWGPNAAIAAVENATGLKFTEYDSVYRTRPMGSNVVTNNRFLPEDRVVFLPDEADVNEFDDTEIGFAKTLTSPHPMGNWQPSFYEWERETTDPWGRDVGTGVKAFPVFPHMDLTYAVNVLL